MRIVCVLEAMTVLRFFVDWAPEPLCGFGPFGALKIIGAYLKCLGLAIVFVLFII